MKLIDKFLKVLKTDRNTFFTYILTLLSAYLMVDRIVEILFLAFSGIAVSYWGPIQYTFALACPIFAFFFSGASKLVTSDHAKLGFFYTYCIALYVIGISMLVQWVNQLCWFGLLSLPGYPIIATEFAYLFRPALSAITIYIPLTTFFPLFKWLFAKVNDTKLLRDSIFDYGGIDLSDKSIGVGPYTAEVSIGIDKDKGSPVKIPESRRFESLLVVGISGSGKTSMIFEPMTAQDIAKKYFFKEAAKEMGFTALKTGLANLNSPYDNSYINEHFRLSMLQPVASKQKIYDAFMKKLIYFHSGSTYVYRDLGITYMSPDYETISHMKDVAQNYGMAVNLIDPNNPNSPGLNPFVFEDPMQTAVAISTVLKGLYATTNPDVQLAYRENVASQVIENLSILLKLMYPRLHEDDLPTLEDLLSLLNNFDLVEDMCRKLEEDTELAKDYTFQIGYFKKNFYKDSPGRRDVEKYVSAAMAQLDVLLRYPGVKNILCNRTNNLKYDEALENGDVTLICTRRGDLGEQAHKAFGLFFLLLMQYSILRRPGNENSRLPHFLYIDEFPDFICSATEPIFTLYRKYRVATVISAQNLSQLETRGEKYRQTITANCANKIVFGNNSPADNDWWSLELGEKREWKFKYTYNTDKIEYDPKYGDTVWAWKRNYEPGKVQALKFKNCMYKVQDLKGKNVIGVAKLDFLAAKYKEKQNIKEYNFEKFTNGISEKEKINKRKTNKDLNKTHFDNDTPGEIDPVQTDSTDSSFLFNNGDAIVFDLSKKKK